MTRERGRDGQWPARLGAMGPAQFVETWLADGLAASTARAYRDDLRRFADWLGDDVETAVVRLLCNGATQARSLLVLYQAQLKARLAATTVNRRVAAVMSLLQSANEMSVVRWRIRVHRLPARAYRDTRGPGLAAVREMVAYCHARSGKRAARDIAILHLLCGMSLRTCELVGLDVADYEHGNPARLWIRGKGRVDDEQIVLPIRTSDAIRHWLVVRTGEDESMFPALSGAQRGHRITPSGLAWVVADLGRKVGADGVHPHGLRHTGITEAARNCRDVYDLLTHSRHMDPRVAQVYLDRSDADANEISAAVVDRLDPSMGGTV